jgi:large subunit ribosomal protein L19
MANSFEYNKQSFCVGDKVKVSLDIKEDDKVRSQIFEGIIIGVKGREEGKTFTVRKIGANSIGVERILPVLSPTISGIEMVSRGNVRRAKLYYLRDRIGRRALRVKEKIESPKNASKATAARTSSRKPSQNLSSK